MPPVWRRSQGQSLIESCIVVAILCLLFMGLFWISQLYAAKEVLNYANSRGLRAKTVGFNRFMVWKTVRVGAIPTAGRMITPPYSGGPLAQYSLEEPRIPEYLGAQQYGYLDAILAYDRWDSVHFSDPFVGADGALHGRVDETFPVSNVFARSFYAADSLLLSSESALDAHYLLYMDDLGF
jgi:hypothetical protein